MDCRKASPDAWERLLPRLGTVRRDETLISFEGPNHFDPSTDLGFGLDCSVPLIHNAVDGKTPACNLNSSAVAYIAHLIASRKAFLGCITVRTDRSDVFGRSRSFSRSSSMNERDPAATATELNGLKSPYQFRAVLRTPNAAGHECTVIQGGSQGRGSTSSLCE